MSLTIEEIKAAGKVPESFYNIKPGCAIFYASADGISSTTKELVLDLLNKCGTQYENFLLEIKVEDTTNAFLENTIVAKRLNLGSLYRYNLLIARVNSQESVDAFVKEFFNLVSRDDEALKFIDKKPQRSRYDYFEEPSFAPTGMLQMIVMRPRAEEEDEEEKTKEEIEEENELNEILQKVIAYADKHKKDIPIEVLRPLAEGKYILTDDINDYKLEFKNQEFWLKAGTTVKLDMSKLQKAFYLLMLAHPKGIETKRLSEHREELLRYYKNVFKGPMSDNKIEDVDNLVRVNEQEYEINTSALESLRTKLHKNLNKSILNLTNQKPFKVQRTNGVLHVDLPRKFFECKDRDMHFEIAKE